MPNTNEDAFCYTSYNPLTLSFSGCIETLVLQTSNDQIFSHSNNSNLTSASGFLDVITKLTSLKFLVLVVSSSDESVSESDLVFGVEGSAEHLNL